MQITAEIIENECDDLKNALSDLFENEANDEDEARVSYHLQQIDEMFEVLKNVY